VAGTYLHQLLVLDEVRFLGCHGADAGSCGLRGSVGVIVRFDSFQLDSTHRIGL
jgi:hypothetical protein